jgi:hypothetical protein
MAVWRLSPQLKLHRLTSLVHDAFPDLGLIGQLMPLSIISSLVTMVDSILEGSS